MITLSLNGITVSGNTQAELVNQLETAIAFYPTFREKVCGLQPTKPVSNSNAAYQPAGDGMRITGKMIALMGLSGTRAEMGAQVQAKLDSGEVVKTATGYKLASGIGGEVESEISSSEPQSPNPGADVL